MNLKEARIGDVSPVGVFSCGYGPAGQVDVLGNLFDFCANRYDKANGHFLYPSYKHWPEGALAPWMADVKVQHVAIRGTSFKGSVKQLRLTRRIGLREAQEYRMETVLVGVRLIRQPVFVAKHEETTQPRKQAQDQ